MGHIRRISSKSLYAFLFALKQKGAIFHFLFTTRKPKP